MPCIGVPHALLTPCLMFLLKVFVTFLYEPELSALHLLHYGNTVLTIDCPSIFISHAASAMIIIIKIITAVPALTSFGGT